ncbi:MAG: HAD hydrolase-like protein [Corallococcus sp.]|nr:HAD hydrolase-like protein [Corallococcus sp.]MCM1359794.1 HAD hydrolase-like protein [Corallococcus sp.]MCM1395680.1 HAD hydrolase-like protein [Corallococcus sp.]
MKNYKYLIFDFDGTINDTSEGIYHTFKKVLDIMGVGYDGVDFDRHIGPPLEFSYTELVGADRMNDGIALHRKIFAEDNAVNMSRLYDGIENALRQLKNYGFVLSVASSKYQPHAISSIERFGLKDFFASVYGQTEKRGFKSEVLRQLIADHSWDKSRCIMIGDTRYDVDGAHENGIDAMAVTYGFGKVDELKAAKPEMVACSPAEIVKLLSGCIG